MSANFDWPDPEQELQRLKGFQRDTAEYAFRRLYLDTDGTRRFLVADEVGLGKTLVARGIMALAVDHLRRRYERGERIDVVYVCSNADIARQNVRRLSLSGLPAPKTADRLTLLPGALDQLKDAPFHFLALSVGTSLDMGDSQGQARERAVLYWMLDAAWDLRGRAAPMNVLQGWVSSAEGFRRRLRDAEQEVPKSGPVVAGFVAALDEEDDKRRARGEQSLRDEFDEATDRFGRARKRVPSEDRTAQAKLVVALRRLLARSCVRALEPDLVILDEFQRFRDLLDGDSDAALLARELFAFEEGENRSRVLLLSATPYKMYTLRHEASEDDHFREFLRTCDFLEESAERRTTLRADLEQYRRALVAFPEHGPSALVAARDEVQAALRRVMCRTERVRVTGTFDAMLREVPPSGMTLTVGDVRTFGGLQRLADELERVRVIDYWKSAPYLVSFLEGYQFDQRLEIRAASGADRDLAALVSHPGLQVALADIRSYGTIDPGNARLRGLLAQMDAARAGEILWVPPSAPDYQLEGSYRAAAEADFTKRLVFSNWRVVPRAIAALLSYEVERRIARAAGREVNTASERRKRKPLLVFKHSEGRNAAMSVLGLLYPGFVLSEVGAAALDQARGGTLDEVLVEARRLLQQRMVFVRSQFQRSTGLDRKWAWAAPILLDRLAAPAAAESFWRSDELGAEIAADEDTEQEDDEVDDAWHDHVEEAKEMALGRVALGAPPEDLVDSLALLAVAGPGVAVLRALVRACPGSSSRSVAVRIAAARGAWGLRRLFNRSEATDLIRTETLGDAESYARALLEHAARGGLTSVLDEHAHVLREITGAIYESPSEAARTIADGLRDALRVRTGSVTGRASVVSRDGAIEFDAEPIRTHFAAPFGQSRSKEQDEGARSDAVRTAFNSPFWPFVLVSTSVGQEGLDFHTWCHAVVHWNLPNNPVDLEQREGRVHRYKGHAIRKNVARAHAGAPAALGATPTNGVGPSTNAPPRALGGDRWARRFEQAVSALGADARGGLHPFWVHPGPSLIERHVPALPFSRDARDIVDLRRTLAIYRLVFGQPRQDDLVAYLQDHVSSAEFDSVRAAALIDLRPQPTAGTTIVT